MCSFNVMAPVGTQIAAVNAKMPWGAAVNGMVLCSSARSAVSTDGVTDHPQQMASATVMVSMRTRSESVAARDPAGEPVLADDDGSVCELGRSR